MGMELVVDRINMHVLGAGGTVNKCHSDSLLGGIRNRNIIVRVGRRREWD